MVYNTQINCLPCLKLWFVHSKWLVLTFRFLFHFLLFFSRLMISWFIVTTQHLSFTTNKNLQKSNNNDDSVQIPVQFFVWLLKIFEDFCLHAMACWAVTIYQREEKESEPTQCMTDMTDIYTTFVYRKTFRFGVNNFL